MSTPQELASLIAQKTSQQLQAMFQTPADWTPAALDAARAELQKRNITLEPKSKPLLANEIPSAQTNQTNSQLFPVLRMIIAFSQTLRQHAFGLRVWSVIIFCSRFEGEVDASLNGIAVLIAILMFLLSFFLMRFRNHAFTLIAATYFVLGTLNSLLTAQNFFQELTEGNVLIDLLLIAWGIAAIRTQGKHSSFFETFPSAYALEEEMETEIQSALACMSFKEPGEQWQVRVSGRFRTMTCVDRSLPLQTVIKQLVLDQIPCKRSLIRSPSDETFRPLAEQPELRKFWNEIYELNPNIDNSPQHQMLVGALWCIGGIVVTVQTQGRRI